VLSVKLRYLERWIEERRRVACLYNQLLAGLPMDLPAEADWARHVYYMYTIRTPQRDELEHFLAERGIGTQKIYATPIPMQPCYQYLEYSEEDVPISARFARQLLCLPVFPELSNDEVEYVAATIREFFEK
jgi:dTDP-4-amino-4,6-dideoxygalactose transaminase